jgi:hypothetical protein
MANRKPAPFTGPWLDEWERLLGDGMAVRSTIVIGHDWTQCTTRMSMIEDPREGKWVRQIVLERALGNRLVTLTEPSYERLELLGIFLEDELNRYRHEHGVHAIAPIAHVAFLEQEHVTEKRLLPATHPILLAFYGMFYEQICQMERKYGNAMMLSMFKRRYAAFLYQQERAAAQQLLGEVAF